MQGLDSTISGLPATEEREHWVKFLADSWMVSCRTTADFLQTPRDYANLGPFHGSPDGMVWMGAREAVNGCRRPIQPPFCKISRNLGCGTA
jgi:hypothetical protein